MSIKTVPNQKVVTVNKAKCDGENLFGTINRDAARHAAFDLSDGGRLLWMYLAMNKNGFKFASSPEAVSRGWNIKRSRYYNAMKELEEKGYLVCRQGNLYDFFEVPIACKVSESNSSDSNKQGVGIQQVECLDSTHKVSESNTRSAEIKQGNTIRDNTIYNNSSITGIDKTTRCDVVCKRNEYYGESPFLDKNLAAPQALEPTVKRASTKPKENNELKLWGPAKRRPIPWVPKVSVTLEQAREIGEFYRWQPHYYRIPWVVQLVEVYMNQLHITREEAEALLSINKTA